MKGTPSVVTPQTPGMTLFGLRVPSTAFFELKVRRKAKNDVALLGEVSKSQKCNDRDARLMAINVKLRELSALRHFSTAVQT